jgi:hypothetical protein
VFDAAVTRQAGRLRTIAAPDVDDLRTLQVDDVAPVREPAVTAGGTPRAG